MTTNNEDYRNSLKPTTNYNNFINVFYENDKNCEIKPLYAIFKRRIEEKNIGIVCINSAWRSVDDNSNGNLLFPAYMIEEAIDKIEDCEWKFFLLHHPIHWFKEFCQPMIQRPVYKHCNLIFSGHIHESEITTHYKQNNGICAVVSQAALANEKFSIGYSIVELDLSNHSKSTLFKYQYLEEKDSFNEIDIVDISIPTGEEKTEQNILREKILSKVIPELLFSKDLLLNYDNDESNDYVFLDQFNKPVIKTIPKEEVKENFLSNEYNFNYLDLLNNKNNYIIYGHDKSGKTSLLKFIHIKSLKDYSKTGTIPFYIDFKEYTSSGKELNLFEEVRRYYGLSKEKTKRFISDSNFRILIDNYESGNSNSVELINFLEEHKQINIIVCCDYLTSKVFGEIKIDQRELIKLYIHDIPRKEVRTYIEKSKIATAENSDKILEKIIQFCHQIELPINYWTVSLILLVHKKTKFDVTKNIFNLLDSCVDEILEKKHKALSKSKVSFIQIKTICANIAEFLLKDNSQNKYSKTYGEILNNLEIQLNKDIRVKADAKEILDYLIASGVLKTREDNNKVSFRLNGIFEYFVAYYMSKNEVFRDDILSDDLYLSFKNELEIYSGIVNDNESFLELIHRKTQLFFEENNNFYRNIGNPDLILILKVSDRSDVNLKKIIKSLNLSEPLSSDEKDKLRDDELVNPINSDITVKKLYDTSNLTPEIYERYISILARVFKTMEGINNPILLSNVLDFLLETYINFSFFLYDSVEESFKKREMVDKNLGSNSKDLLVLLTKILPFIAQINMTDGIAQHNLEKIIIAKIEELKINKKDNQFKLFILYFILMDIDESNIMLYTDEVFENINISILKYCTILKLKYYYDFNSTSNKKLSDFLKKKIEYGKLRLNSDENQGDIQKHLNKQGAKNRYFKN